MHALAPDPTWHDDSCFVPVLPSTALRQISVTQRSRSVRGSLVTPGPAARVLTFESGLEAKAAVMLLARREVVELREQYPVVVFEDDYGSVRQHWFDLFARLRDETKIAFAVRPRERIVRKGLDRDLQLIAAQVSRDVVDRLVLVTEDDLPRDRVHDATLLLDCRGDPPCPADDAVRTLAMSLRGTATVGGLVAASGHGGQAFRAVARLIADGTVEIVGKARIGYDTRIALARRAAA